jgi:hypothetical protein
MIRSDQNMEGAWVHVVVNGSGSTSWRTLKVLGDQELHYVLVFPQQSNLYRYLCPQEQQGDQIIAQCEQVGEK